MKLEQKLVQQVVKRTTYPVSKEMDAIINSYMIDRNIKYKDQYRYWFRRSISTGKCYRISDLMYKDFLSYAKEKEYDKPFIKKTSKKYNISEDVENKIDAFLRDNYNLNKNSFVNTKSTIRRFIVTGEYESPRRKYMCDKFLSYLNVEKENFKEHTNKTTSEPTNTNSNTLNPKQFLKSYTVKGQSLTVTERAKIEKFIVTKLLGDYNKDILFLQSSEDSIYDLFKNVIDSFVETYHPKESEDIIKTDSQPIETKQVSLTDIKEEVREISVKVKYIKEDMLRLLERLSIIEKQLATI